MNNSVTDVTVVGKMVVTGMMVSLLTFNNANTTYKLDSDLNRMIIRNKEYNNYLVESNVAVGCYVNETNSVSMISNSVAKFKYDVDDMELDHIKRTIPIKVKVREVRNYIPIIQLDDLYEEI